MEIEQSLEGACSCGRNEYVILIPFNSVERAKVLFDDGPDHRRSHSSPLPAFLRIPLHWLQSTTYAYYPDESHNDIRRAFTPRHAPHVKRHFCGFCGTPLTYWSEETREEAEWVCVNLSSLETRSLNILGDAGIMPSVQEVEPANSEVDGAMDVATSSKIREVGGQPWFEDIVEGSKLGRLRRRRGGNTSSDGRIKVEWEVVEFDARNEESLGDSVIGPAKRKIGDIVEPDDIVMRSGH